MEKECRFGHQCTSDCQNTKDCPCQDEHCCALTENCDGSCDDCFNKEDNSSWTDRPEYDSNGNPNE